VFREWVTTPSERQIRMPWRLATAAHICRDLGSTSSWVWPVFCDGLFFDVFCFTSFFFFLCVCVSLQMPFFEACPQTRKWYDQQWVSVGQISIKYLSGCNKKTAWSNPSSDGHRDFYPTWPPAQKKNIMSHVANTLHAHHWGAFPTPLMPSDRIHDVS